MEFFLFIALVVVCVVVAANSSGSSSKPARSAPPGLPLQFRCRTEQEQLPDLPFPLEMLVFELSNLTILGDGAPYQLRVRMVDTTEGQNLSVFCAIESLQAPGSNSFLTTQSLPQIPPGMVLNIDNFSQVVSVPKEVLMFPRSGIRSLLASLEVLRQGKVVQSAQTKFTLDVEIPGYIEAVEDIQRSEEMGIYLAMHLAAADGNIDKSEAEVVREWVRQILSSDETPNREERKERLNTVITDAFTKAKVSGLDLDYIASELEEHAPMPMKYEIIELCMDVMKADDVADPNEVRELKRIAELIGLDEGRYSALLDKRLAEVSTIDASSEESLGSLVGITSSMSKAEIKKHLNKEYRKWNARVSHDDDAIRERAEQMLEHIAAARRQYL